MSADATLATPRLILRPWRDADLPAFAALNADPRVRAHFVETLDRAASDAEAARIRARNERAGYDNWAVEIPGLTAFAGFVSLGTASFPASFTPCPEMGWRFASAHWGQGYATEAARAVLGYGFGTLRLDQIIAVTAPENQRSWRLMERLGMAYEDDFEHPNVPDGHRLRLHRLYRIRRADWIG